MIYLNTTLSNLIREVWKDIKDYEGYYQVSSLGRVKSLTRTILRADGTTAVYKGRIIRQKLNKGYLLTKLSKNDIKYTPKVHRLVCQAFHKNRDNKTDVNHIDGNKLNNCFSNLEWCSRANNQNHASDLKLFKPKYKPVQQIDVINNEIIKSFKSIKEAIDTTSIHNIIKVCRGKQKTAGGYIWKYA